MKTNYLVMSLLIISCNSKVKHENNPLLTNDTSKTIVGIKVLDKDTNKLNGLWVSISYINDLNKYHSITETERRTKSVISIFIRDTLIEGLEFYQQTPWVGVVSKDNIDFSKKSYRYFINERAELCINDTLNSYCFKKIDTVKGLGSDGGRNYLYSYLFLGNYKFIDSYSNSTYDISFCENNELRGFMNYKNFYPSSYLGNDILLIRDNKEHKTLSFIFKYCETGFTLEEVKDFDWNDEPLVKTGRIFKLEKQ